jgi:hypothetical protein
MALNAKRHVLQSLTKLRSHPFNRSNYAVIIPQKQIKHAKSWIAQFKNFKSYKRKKSQIENMPNQSYEYLLRMMLPKTVKKQDRSENYPLVLNVNWKVK